MYPIGLIRYSFQCPKATAWIYRIGVNPGVYTPVAFEIGFAGKAPMKNLKTFYNIHAQILMRNPYFICSGVALEDKEKCCLRHTQYHRQILDYASGDYPGHRT